MLTSLAFLRKKIPGSILTSELGNAIMILPSVLVKTERKKSNMKKEEILEKIKQENKKKDPYVLQVQFMATALACTTMLLLAFIYLVYELKTYDSWNPAIYSIITAYIAVFTGYRGMKIEKDRGVYLIWAIVSGIFTILLILEYFKVI